MYETHPKFWGNKLHIFNILMYKMYPKFSFQNILSKSTNLTQSLKFRIIISISKYIILLFLSQCGPKSMNAIF